jgi:hypothetical protein
MKNKCLFYSALLILFNATITKAQTYHWDTIFTPHDGFQTYLQYPENSLYIGNQKWLITGKFNTVAGLKEIGPTFINGWTRGIVYNDNLNRFESLPNFIVSGFIYRLYKQNDSIIVVGSFTSVGFSPSLTVQGIAIYRLSNNTWSTYGSAPYNGLSTVYAYAVVGGTPYIGGGFTNVNSSTFNNIARFNISTSSWEPITVGTATGVSSQINDLITDGNNLYLCGFFNTAGQTTANRVAMYVPSSNTFLPLQGPGGEGISGSSANPIRMLYHNNNLYIGGTFSQCGGTITAYNIARYNFSTNTWHSIGTTTANGVSGQIHCFEKVGDTLYAAGSFSAYNYNGTTGNSCQNIVGIRLTTNSLTPAGISFTINGGSNHVATMSYGYNNRVFVGGYFVTVNNTQRLYNGGVIWRRNPNKVFQMSFGKGVIGMITAMHKHNNYVYLGNVKMADTTVIHNICRFDPATNTYSNLGLGIGYDQFSGSGVFRIISRNDTLFVVGRFLTAGGQTVNSVAGYKTSTGTWFGMGSGIGPSNHQVKCVELYGNNVIVGGAFNTAGGNNIRNLAMYNLSTNTWTSVGSSTVFPVNSYVNDIIVIGNQLIAIGTFSSVNSVVCNGIAKYDFSTNTWTNVGTGFLDNSNSFSSSIYGQRLKWEGNQLYVCGSFTKFNGVTCNSIARFDPSTNSVTAIANGTFNGIGNGSGVVNDVIADGNRIIYAGFFSPNVFAQPSQFQFIPYNVMGYDFQSNIFFPVSTYTHSGVNSNVYSIIRYNPNQYYLGGSFQYYRYSTNTTSLNAMACSNIARVNYSIPTAVSENISIQNISPSVRLFPNPASEVLFIELMNEGEELENACCYDVNGKQILHTEKNELITSNLLPGVYIIRIMTKNHKSYTQKFIKE